MTDMIATGMEDDGPKKGSKAERELALLAAAKKEIGDVIRLANLNDLETRAAGLIAEFKALGKIDTKAKYVRAVELAKESKGCYQEMKERCEPYNDIYRQRCDVARDWMRQHVDPLVEIEKALKAGFTLYEDEQRRIEEEARRKAQAEADAKIAAERARQEALIREANEKRLAAEKKLAEERAAAERKAAAERAEAERKLAAERAKVEAAEAAKRKAEAEKAASEAKGKREKADAERRLRQAEEDAKAAAEKAKADAKAAAEKAKADQAAAVAKEKADAEDLAARQERERQQADEAAKRQVVDLVPDREVEMPDRVPHQEGKSRTDKWAARFLPNGKGAVVFCKWLAAQPDDMIAELMTEKVKEAFLVPLNQMAKALKKAMNVGGVEAFPTTVQSLHRNRGTAKTDQDDDDAAGAVA